MTYLITFCCYGSRVPGEAGVVNRRYNLPGSRALPENPGLATAIRGNLANPPYQPEAAQRTIILKAIEGVCSHRAWTLLAAHVRSTHVHVVLEADCAPEKAMNAFKAYSSRALNLHEIESSNDRRWARHGSTVYLWTQAAVAKAIYYVTDKQGEPMAVYAVEQVLR